MSRFLKKISFPHMLAVISLIYLAVSAMLILIDKDPDGLMKSQLAYVAALLAALAYTILVNKYEKINMIHRTLWLVIYIIITIALIGSVINAIIDLTVVSLMWFGGLALVEIAYISITLNICVKRAAIDG
jgi:low temperature requirement protein LtrA